MESGLCGAKWAVAGHMGERDAGGKRRVYVGLTALSGGERARCAFLHGEWAGDVNSFLNTGWKAGFGG